MKNNKNKNVCAFLGAYDSEVSKATGVLTTIRGVPQISGQSTASELDDSELYGMFARTIPNEREVAYHLVQYLYQTLQLRYCVIMYTNGSYGHSFVKSIRNAVRDLNPLTTIDDELTIRYIVFDNDGDGIVEGIKELKRSEYRFIVAILRGRQLHDTLLLEAYTQEVAGDGIHNWMFVDGYSAVLEGRLFDKNSPLERAYRGTGIVKASGYGDDIHSSKHIEFHKQMMKLRDDYYNQNSTWLPTYNTDDIEDEEGVDGDDVDIDLFHYDNYNWSHLEDVGYDSGPFMYEATILVGLAACQEMNYQMKQIRKQHQEQEHQQEQKQEIVQLLGEDFYRRIVQTTFEGISGPVVLDQITGTRKPNTTSYKIVNYVEEIYENATNYTNTDGTYTYTPTQIEFVPITTYEYKTSPILLNSTTNTTITSDGGDGGGDNTTSSTISTTNTTTTNTVNGIDGYFPGEWIEIHPYTYNDGRNELPLPGDLPPAAFQLKTVSRTIRVVSLFMCGIAVSMALSFGIWTYLHRKTRIVRASQPFFLYLLIFGVLLYVLSIVPLTKFHTVEEEAYIKPLSEQRHQADHDDEYGKSRGDIDCTVVVWLASLGFSIAYSALFAKTYRINKIMRSAKKLRRIKLTVKDTLTPVIVVFACNIVVLTVMSIYAPVEHSYFVQEYDQFDRPIKAYAYCDFGNPATLPYSIILVVIDIGIMLLATYQAWRSRNLSTEFSETKVRACLRVIFAYIYGTMQVIAVYCLSSSVHSKCKKGSNK